MEQETEEKKPMDKLCEQVDKKIEELLQNGVQQSNIDYFYKLVDIKKDIKEMEDNNMRYYGNYGTNYGRRDSMGRYAEGGNNYARRGVDTKYRGEEMLDEMSYHYGNYHDNYNTGNYGAKEDSAYKMTEAFKKFGYSIAEELEPNEKMMFKQAMQEIMQELDR